MSSGKPRRVIGLVLVLAGLVSSCTPGVSASGSDMGSAPATIPAQGQQLPITAIALVGHTRIELEVASTPEQQEIGLMFRAALPDHRGMLFPFNPPRPVSFWMQNCLISLDMVFIRLGRVVAIVPNAPPCNTDPCPLYHSRKPVDQVLELRGGRAAALGLSVGDTITVEPLPVSK